jgi:hypothetical protein
MQRILEKLEKIPVIYIITFFFVLTLFIYGISLSNGFVWDDEEQVINNSVIRTVSNIPYLFTSSTFNTGGAGLSGWYYKPLMPVSFSLVYNFFGPSAFGFHLFDISFHFLNSVFVFLILKRLFKLQHIRYSKSIAFLLSAIFLVHPANTESVAYISSTQELLYVFFSLIAIFFISGKEEKFSIKRTILISFAILLALLSKESGIVSIPLVIIFTFLFKKKNTILVTISSLLTFVFYLILRFPIAKTPLLQHSKIIPIANADLINRLKTIPVEIFSYLRLFFFPKDLFVAQHWVITNFSDPRFYVSFLFFVLTVFFLIYILIHLRSKLSVFFIAWIIFSFFLLLNIYPLDMTLAERWLYGPMIGILGLAGVFIGNFKQKKLSIVFLIFMLLIPILSVRTFTRILDWKNNLTLFSNDEKFSKNSFDLQNNLGVALFREGKQSEAKKHFERSIILSPNWWTAANNLGVIYQREGNLENAKKMYAISIKNGDYYLAYENLAQLKYLTEEPKDTISFLEKALKKLPNNEILNKYLALSYLKTGNVESAKIYAERTFLLNNSQENYLLIQEINNTFKNED